MKRLNVGKVMNLFKQLNRRRAVLAAAATLYIISILFAPWVAKVASGKHSVYWLSKLTASGLLRTYHMLFYPPVCEFEISCLYVLDTTLLYMEWIFIAIIATIAWLWKPSQVDSPLPQTPPPIHAHPPQEQMSESQPIPTLTQIADPSQSANPWQQPLPNDKPLEAVSQPQMNTVPDKRRGGGRDRWAIKNIWLPLVLVNFAAIFIVGVETGFIVGEETDGSPQVGILFMWSTFAFGKYWQSRNRNGWVGAAIGLSIAMVIAILGGVIHRAGY